jgi:CBS-domain-containing membrane protein
MNTKRVADLMTRDVAVINSKSDVHELEKLLLEKRVHGLPVVNDDGILVGVISQTDLLAWHYNSGVDGAAFYDTSRLHVTDEGSMAGLQLTDIQTASVEEVMSPLVHCIRADLPIAVAASTMVDQRIHRLVVVDDALRVQGVISALDILQAIPGVEELVQPEADVLAAAN